ncbi:early endosome antigen 1 isoform X2 [Anabas testudineus]|uniref:early endosome antigen 1 isoform X2 n=1 Tax=Anabas testudineus TaxID=64144 RepID=UPI000E457E0C|nr:early endosome antigen 1 isoform X2 [Anabas testudineus]
MGTQGPGRKRIPNREKLVAEDDALNQIAREAEARLAAKRAARAEAREIRMKELERHQKELFHSQKKYYGLDNKWGHIEQWMEDSERYSRHSRRHTSISDDEERMSVGSRGSLRVEDRMDRDFLDKGSRTASTLSAATLASLGGASSRRGSCDTSFSVETEASIREIKDSLAEVEEKYRKAMVSNAQLHNEKSTLIYQVETLREELSDLEELLWEARRQYHDSGKELERERQAHHLLQFQFKEMRDTLRQAEELLTALERQREISDIVRIERDRLRGEVVELQDVLKNHGVVIPPEISTNGDKGQGKTGDDITTYSASRLAEESSHVGRESTLGQVQKQKPPSTGGIYERTQLLRLISSPEPAKPDNLKQHKQGRTEEPLFRNEEIKTNPLTNEPQAAAAAQVYGPKSGASEELKEPVRDFDRVHEKTHVDQTKTPTSLMLPFVPRDMLFHPLLCHLGQSMLRGFVEYHDLVTKISRVVPLIPGPLSRWILELEDKLKNVAENVSDQLDNIDRGSFKDFTKGRIPSTSRPSTKTKNHSSVKKPEEKQSENDPKASGCHESCLPEPLKIRAPHSGLNQGVMTSIVEDQAAGVVSGTSQQGVSRIQSFVVPVGETQLKRLQAFSTNPEVNQSSNVQRFVEITTDDIELVIPQISLVSLKEGTISEEEPIDRTEEVGRDVTAPQPATEQHGQPAMEVVGEEVKVGSVLSGRKCLKGFSLNNRKHKHRSDCKSS